MGIFTRISDILSANLNEITEQFEDPEKMLKQAVREMEASIGEVTGQTAKAMANEKTLTRELQRNRTQQEQWQSRAEKAVATSPLPSGPLTSTIEGRERGLQLVVR